MFQHVMVTVAYMDMEFHPECLHDALTISGPNVSFPLLTMCGDLCTPSVTMTTHLAVATFRSDFSDNGFGFQLWFEGKEGDAE